MDELGTFKDAVLFGLFISAPVIFEILVVVIRSAIKSLKARFLRWRASRV